jgi:gliding motility-associated-like protein
VEDASGCVSSASSNAILNAQPSTPSVPGIGSITQPDCVTNTGSVVLNGLPASGTWVLTSTPGSLTQTGTGTSTTFTGLTAGTTYTFTVENAAGCVSIASGNVVIDPLPSGPTAPTASVTVQPTCTSPTGTIVVTSPTGSSYEYSIDGSTYQASGTFGSLSPGSYDVTVQDVNTLCVSSPTVLIVDPLPAGPSAPVASITAQPTCLDPFGTIQITSPTGANYEFSINGTPIPIGTYSVSNLDPSQTYGITVTDQTTGCSSSSFDVTINAVPSAAAVNAGPDLMIEAGDTVILTATGVGTIIWENGDVSSTIVSPALTTTYTVTLTDANSCTSTDQVTVTVLDACGEVFIPTAFSPNGDALNSFRIKVENECVVEMSLKVFDRWGEVIFEGIKADDSWDGTFKGKPLDSAVFVYTLDILLSNSSEHQLYSGNLTLIR